MHKWLVLQAITLAASQQLTLGSSGAALSNGGENTSSVVLTAPGGATLTLSTNSQSGATACAGPDVEVVEGQCRPKSHTIAANIAGYIQREVEIQVAAALANLTSAVADQAATVAAVQGTVDGQASALSALNTKTASLEVSGGALRITQAVTLSSTFQMTTPTMKFSMCRSCGSSAYTCTREQAALKCASEGRRLCTRDEVAAFAEMGGSSCCWGWTSTLSCDSGMSCSAGYVVFPMSHSQTTGHSGGCGGDAGGLRITTYTHTALSSAHCCSF